MSKKYSVLLSFIFLFSLSAKEADILIYSFNRPLQLYALLESIEKHFVNVQNIYVIVRSSTKEFKKAYDNVFTRFNYCIVAEQKSKQDFKPFVCKYAFKKSVSDYIMFAVDDIVVTDNVDLSVCIETLEQTNAYGFYLRLGKNITWSYMSGINTSVPNFKKVIDDICVYKFKDGLGDWAYPNSNDMVLYKKSNVERDVCSINFEDTGYEGPWAQMAKLSLRGLFFEHSKIINIPLNLVIKKSNKNMNLYSVKQLLTIFNHGFKMDINQFYQIENNSPHMPIAPIFIKR